MSLNEDTVKIKRTRKSKKQLLEEQTEPVALAQTPVVVAQTQVVAQTPVVLAQTPLVLAEMAEVKEEFLLEEEEQNENIIIDNENVVEKIHKKRGRKPKGGKIIVNNVQPEKIFIPTPNVIMHLKCRVADLVQPEFLSSIIYNPSINQVETFQFGHEMGYDIIQSSTVETNNTGNYNEPHKQDNNMLLNEQQDQKSGTEYNANDVLTNTVNKEKNNSLSLITIPTDNHPQHHRSNNSNEYDMKTITAKLKELTTNLHLNNISYKKSACFWCTHDFDNPAIFIPKHEISGIYHCYGCFCSPECATAFLFKEHIDTATRFERYHLINHIYCKIYGYNKNVKPAPDPFYLLNKYYGNLTIQEYRQLLKNERLLIIVDKPLSRTLPELHEDNDDFMFNGKTIPSANKFKLKKKNKQTIKNDILSENFNMK